jgi:hypothetical protein
VPNFATPVQALISFNRKIRYFLLAEILVISFTSTLIKKLKPLINAKGKRCVCKHFVEKGSKRLLLGGVGMMGLGCPRFPPIIALKGKKLTKEKAHSHCLVFGECVHSQAGGSLIYFILDLWVFIFSGPHFPRLHHKNHGRDDVSDIECRAATKKNSGERTDMASLSETL